MGSSPEKWQVLRSLGARTFPAYPSLLLLPSRSPGGRGEGEAWGVGVGGEEEEGTQTEIPVACLMGA